MVLECFPSVRSWHYDAPSKGTNMSSLFEKDHGIERIAKRAAPATGTAETSVNFSVRLHPLLSFKLLAMSRVVSMSRNQLMVELLQTAVSDLFQQLDQASQEAVVQLVDELTTAAAAAGKP